MGCCAAFYTARRGCDEDATVGINESGTTDESNDRPRYPEIALTNGSLRRGVDASSRSLGRSGASCLIKEARDVSNGIHILEGCF